MRIEAQSAESPNALRIMVTTDDDADGIEFALATAGQWCGSEKTLLVINATGKDLAGYARRHAFSVLLDDAGHPTRSMSEIAEAVESIDSATFGAIVFLDTNRLYRGARCSVRWIEDIKALNPGHWDDTAEAIGRVFEAVSRSGIPSILVAPPTDVYGSNEDGEPMVVGKKPQVWKDGPRQSHISIMLSRRGVDIDALVSGDDFRVLGRPGEVLRATTGARVGAALAELAQGRPGHASGTTLAESTAAELEARGRLAALRGDRSRRLTARLLGIMSLRAFQGPAAWAAYMTQVVAARPEMSPADRDALHDALDRSESVRAAGLARMRALHATSERAPIDAHVAMGVFGPAVDDCPGRADMPVERVLSDGLDLIESEDLEAWVASIAQYAGVWSIESMDAVARAAKVPSAGRSWSLYSDAQLRALVVCLYMLAVARHEHDPPAEHTEKAAPIAPRPSHVVLVDPDEYDDRWEVLAGCQDDAEQPAKAAVSVKRASIELPTENEFADLDRSAGLTCLEFMLARGGWWDRIRDLHSMAGTRVAKPRDVASWPDDVRLAVFQALTTGSARRAS
jgi:hypothetical protein